ncbi:GlsB/YeaQ/YmgE family stress response membrane protein [Pigmentiphaga sp. NML080357]|uniref:GlsB/YeaQ/YmgE family stress response membrane protein n=1 Tax=Pigmentiphaga sp. NML080357 TaxID=2008675 RepID=UPI000B4222E5|nr:GlsB/YeaQ/YmgE family stress response membrane protein [Pigmentiphaga sp. NML080357]OVZ63703.1 GlsB/YeaQ/YmgE family stress response membrane protein [Pigmentiphaga sp. NML080357]
MLSLLGTLLVGLVVGLLARAIKPGNDSMGWIMTIVLGVAGSLIAGYAGRALGWYQPGEPAGWIASVVGAIVLLLIYGMVAKKKSA